MEIKSLYILYMPFTTTKTKNKNKDVALPTTDASDIIITRDKEIADIIGSMMIKISSIVQSNVKIQAGDAVELVANVMELVEKINRPDLNLQGIDKAFIAIKVASQGLDLIPESKLSKIDKEDIKALIPPMIDIIIKATKGSIPVDANAPIRTGTNIDTVVLSKKIYERLKIFIVEKKFDAQTISVNVVILVGYAVSILNEYQNISLNDKKIIVNQTIGYLTTDLPVIFPGITDDNLRIAQMALMLAPTIIDNIILAAFGSLDINKIIESTKGCFAGCFERCKK